MKVAAKQQTTEKKQLKEPPEGASEEDEDLDQILANLQVKVQELAGKTDGRQGYNPNLDLDGIIHNLERTQEESSNKADSKWGKIQEVFNHTLTAVGKVGGMVAAAASQVRCSMGSERIRV